MEDAVKDQSSVLASGGRSSSKLLRYPLRSATKAKEVKPLPVESSIPSAPRRGRPASSVSKSIGVLDLSGKEKLAKPPRRLSTPAKATASPKQKPIGNITPISEARASRSVKNQGKSDTPISDVSRPSSRRKFSLLASTSYWLSQIKLSESAAKHSVSLGFFKLASDAGCEPLHTMRDELKSYAQRHNLVELGEPVKELFESYNIENFEQLHISETSSQVPDEGIRSSDDEVHSSSSVTATQELQAKVMNSETSPHKESAKDTTEKHSVIKVRGSLNKNIVNSRSSEVRVKKPNKQEAIKVKKQGKKSVNEGGSIIPLPAEEALQENKENLDAPRMEEM